MQLVKERWQEQYGGYTHWDEIGVLDQGGEFQRISPTFDEMGFESIDERNEARNIISSILFAVKDRTGQSRSGFRRGRCNGQHVKQYRDGD